MRIQQMTSKQRAYLRSLAMNIDPILFIGKESLTPENTQNIEEALAKRELIKLSVQKNCVDDIRSIAEAAADRTHAQVVQVIGRKIVLYRAGKDNNRRIELPR